jgi:molybdopterin synthase catalytic subunit
MSTGEGSSHKINAFEYVNYFIEYCKQKMLWHSYTHIMEAEVVMTQK